MPTTGKSDLLQLATSNGVMVMVEAVTITGRLVSLLAIPLKCYPLVFVVPITTPLIKEQIISTTFPTIQSVSIRIHLLL